MSEKQLLVRLEVAEAFEREVRLILRRHKSKTIYSAEAFRLLKTALEEQGSGGAGVDPVPEWKARLEATTSRLRALEEALRRIEKLADFDHKMNEPMTGNWVGHSHDLRDLARLALEGET